LIVFFALLAGFFHPLITYTNFDGVIGGVLILFLGLAGGVLLYRATTSKSKRTISLGSGFVLITISLFYIFQITGRS
jgi:peptidoglycan/LPS O-acetylase OafA/YrhL